MRAELERDAVSFAPLPQDAAPEAVLERVDAAGIVGMGGAGYPTARKIREAIAGGADMVIGNGMASESGADRALLRQRGAEVRRGLAIVAGCLGGARCVLAVPPGADAGADVVEVPAHPAGGDERHLAERIAGRRVAPGAYATDVRVLVLNVATLFAVFEAVALGRPPRRRLVSVAGDDVWVAIGTPLAELNIPADGLRVGGALTGRPAHPGETVQPTTFSVAPAPPAALACIRCGRCEAACPESLIPDLLHAAFETGADDATAWNCIECGACTAACPSGIDLVNEIRAVKVRMAAEQASRRAADAARQRSEARARRLARQAEAHHAKRSARLRAPRRW